MRRVRVQGAVLLASAEDVEAQYYEALQQADLERLMAAWADDEDVVCVHPDRPRVIGHAAVRASYAAMLGAGALIIAPEQVRRLQGMGSAVHHLVERVLVETPAGPVPVYVVVTNVYLRTAQGWRMVAHHASPGQAEPPDAAPEWPATVH